MSGLEPLSIAGISQLLDNSIDKLIGKLQTVKVRYQSTQYHYSAVTSAQIKKGNFEPILTIEPPSKKEVRLTRLQVIFDDVPSVSYVPKISIRVNGVDIFTTLAGNPFKTSDIDLDLGTGMTIDRNDKIEIIASYLGADTGDKEISVSYTFGEY